MIFRDDNLYLKAGFRFGLNIIYETSHNRICFTALAEQHVYIRVFISFLATLF